MVEFGRVSFSYLKKDSIKLTSFLTSGFFLVETNNHFAAQYFLRQQMAS
jgi:hypothetical protein